MIIPSRPKIFRGNAAGCAGPVSYTHLRHSDPACDLNLVVNEGKQADIRIAMSNSLGFGGHNASILIRRWEK